MSEIKILFEEKLKNALQADPLCMKEAGIQNVRVGIDIEQEGAWSFHFDQNGAVSMLPGVDGACQCSVHTNEKTFLGVVKGTVNVPMAYVMKKIKVKGDIGLAVKVGIGIQKAIAGKKS